MRQAKLPLMRSIVLNTLALLVLTQVIGCNRAVIAPNPIVIAAAEYHRVFDASVDVLREHKFTVDRKDRRFGVVSSKPLPASSVLEPWQTDNTVAQDYSENTLHFQRRSVRVELRPITPAPADPAQPASPGRASTTPATGDYELEVIVNVDRLYHPPVQLISAALRPFDFRHQRKRYREVTTEYGVDASYWQPVGRDAGLEKRLLAQILRTATFNTEPPRFDPAMPMPTPESQK